MASRSVFFTALITCSWLFRLIRPTLVHSEVGRNAERKFSYAQDLHDLSGSVKVDINGRPIRFCDRCQNGTALSLYFEARHDGAGSCVMSMIFAMNFAAKNNLNFIGECGFYKEPHIEGFPVYEDRRLLKHDSRDNYENSRRGLKSAMLIHANVIHHLDAMVAMSFVFDDIARVTREKIDASKVSGEASFIDNTPRNRQGGVLELLFKEQCSQIVEEQNSRLVSPGLSNAGFAGESIGRARRVGTFRDIFDEIACREGKPTINKHFSCDRDAQGVTTFVIETATYLDMMSMLGLTNAEDIIDASFHSKALAPLVRQRSWQLLFSSPEMPKLLGIGNNSIGNPQNKRVRVALHLRRGDVSPNWTGFRFISDDTYIEIVDMMRSLIPDSDIFAYSYLELNTTRQSFVFLEAKGVQMRYNDMEDVSLTWAQMITADVFVMAPSAFSWVPAVFSDGCIIRPTGKRGSFPATMAHWMLAEDLLLDRAPLIRCLERVRAM